VKYSSGSRARARAVFGVCNVFRAWLQDWLAIRSRSRFPNNLNVFTRARVGLTWRALEPCTLVTRVDARISVQMPQGKVARVLAKSVNDPRA
jgi:hypothetical protein